MKIIHIKNSFIPKILKANAIVLYPFVFYKEKEPSLKTINHEAIHIQQIEKIGVIRYYLSYQLEFLSLYIRGNSLNEAYRKISYEIEAYENERDYNYINREKL